MTERAALIHAARVYLAQSRHFARLHREKLDGARNGQRQSSDTSLLRPAWVKFLGKRNKKGRRFIFGWLVFYPSRPKNNRSWIDRKHPPSPTPSTSPAASIAASSNLLRSSPDVAPSRRPSFAPRPADQPIELRGHLAVLNRQPARPGEQRAQVFAGAVVNQWCRLGEGRRWRGRRWRSEHPTE